MKQKKVKIEMAITYDLNTSQFYGLANKISKGLLNEFYP